MKSPVLDQLNLVVRDMDTTLAFYRLLGLDIPEESVFGTESGAHHVEVAMPSGFDLSFDSEVLASHYDSGWKPAARSAGRCMMTFRTVSRDDVDARHAELLAAGHPSAQEPYDAFWGSRHAIVEDPDGNHVGLMSPSDAARRSAPPPL
ncbi:MAG: VOC family protein [Deltaproteobacteria bacterium]|nr:VOC family protein [Deltaproteobacteria bacterium]MBW2415670.1 VOC family protein [Deltaproteobacteria bacterium]